jgi:hypothetical protein
MADNQSRKCRLSNGNVEPLQAALHAIGVLLLQATVARGASTEVTETASAKVGGDVTEATQDSTPNTAESPWTHDFSLLEEYRLRIASNALPNSGALGEPLRTNQQTDQHLRLLGDGEVTGFNEHFRAVASGALWYDIDGAPPPGTASLFASQYDNTQPWLAAYALSAELRKYKTLDHFRIGRQSAEHGMPLTFDGASLSIRVLDRKLQLFAFGGRTVHFFDTEPGLLENRLVSTGAVLRPAHGTAIEFDSRLIRELTLNDDRSQRDAIVNHSYGLSASFSGDTLSTKVYARGIDQRASHVGGAFSFQSEPLGFGLDARVHAQLVTLGEVVESENPFYSLLGRSLPFARFRFESWKEFQLGQESRLGLYAGWRARQVMGATESTFNRSTGAVYLNARADDVFRRGIFFSATAERHYVPKSFDREWILVFGGSTGYTTATVKTELGTYFQQYKINYYQTAEELHNARTVYGSLGVGVTSWLELRGRYEIDIFDRYLQTFYLSARQEL